VSDYVDFDPWLEDRVGIVRGPRAKPHRQSVPASIVHSTLSLPVGAEAELLDISGRRVMELQSGENDIRHLAPGVYFVREEGSGIQGSQGPSVRKVVIQK